MNALTIIHSFSLLSIFLFFLSSSFLSLSSSLETRAHPCVSSVSCPHHDFQLVGRAHPRESLRLSFAVKNKNVEQLYQVVNDVSNPKSPNYGKHWTFEQIGELTSDSQAKELVLSHLSSFVEPSQLSWSRFTNFISVDTDVETAEKILQGSFHNFHSKTTGKRVTRLLEFGLPEQVKEVLDYVSPTTQFPSSKPGPMVVHSSPTERQTTKEITPAILNKYYNITSNKVTNPGANQSVFEIDESFWAKDLSQFQKEYKLPKDEVDQIVGKYDSDLCKKKANKCVESTLDLQYIMSIAQLAPMTYWNVDNSMSFGTWIEQLASTPNPPLVHSVSWGGIEKYTDVSEQQRFSEEAAKLGARGVTLVIASGDYGVSNFLVAYGKKYCGFTPSYPSNVPYVVTVGATMGPESGQPETACQADKGAVITSEGDFSELFPRPDYQKSVVEKYLSNDKVTSNSIFPTNTMFNPSGRAYPDISMAGDRYWVIVNQTHGQVSGASASTPVFAAVLTLVNNARLNKGKSPVGFVNPALYQLYESDPSIFNDVTKGNNRCSADLNPPICCDYGFPCSQGWDPVTGLGSVNVGRLVEALSRM